MNAVQKYIESMFLGLPNDPDIQGLKENLVSKSTQHYEAMTSEGLSPQDALAKIIIELEDEEKAIMNAYLDKQTREDLYTVSLTLDEAEDFIALNRKTGSRIGRAILYILIAVGLIPFLDLFNLAEVGVVLLLLVIAFSVGMMIMAGMRISDQYGEENQQNFLLSNEDSLILQNEFKSFKSKERYRIPLGVGLCIASPIPLLLFSFLGNESLVEALGVLILVVLVGLGVYQFIQYGMTHSAYERLLKVGEYTTENLAYERKLEPLSGIYWMLVTLIYLGWSFLTMDWHISWIIWPLAGVFWGIIVLVIKAITEESK